jgi:hypothetical protein
VNRPGLPRFLDYALLIFSCKTNKGKAGSLDRPTNESDEPGKEDKKVVNKPMGGNHHSYYIREERGVSVFVQCHSAILATILE